MLQSFHKIIIPLVILVVTTLFWQQVYAQGCNDAGLCTIGHNGIGESFQEPVNTLGLNQELALGEQNTLILTSEIVWNSILFKTLSLQIKSPFSIRNGNLGTAAGLGDPSVALSYPLIHQKDKRWIITSALKLPGNKADKTMNGRALPMVYQSSLGTIDFIGALNFINQKWHWALAYQKAVIHLNQNEFNHELPQLSNQERAYFESSGLIRGDDIMLRISRRFSKNDGNWFFGIMPIYRLHNDKIRIQDQEIRVPETKGLTMNINAGWSKQLKNNSILKISLGAPLITREVRTDGLTRTATIHVSYTFLSHAPVKLNQQQLKYFNYQK